MRALFPEMLDDADVRAVYAVDASAVELTWIAGPPLALGIGVLWSTGGALIVAALVVLVGTVAFAAQPVSREWRPRALAHQRRGGALRAPAVRTLVLVLVAVGTLFGAVEVAVAAATEAGGSSAAVGPLLGIWGAGSLLGGLLAARAGGGAQSAAGLTLVLGALAAGHLALVPAAGSVLAMAAVLLVAGAAIAPAYASIYAMVERALPRARSPRRSRGWRPRPPSGRRSARRPRALLPRAPARRRASCSPRAPASLRRSS